MRKIPEVASRGVASVDRSSIVMAGFLSKAKMDLSHASVLSIAAALKFLTNCWVFHLILINRNSLPLHVSLLS